MKQISLLIIIFLTSVYSFAFGPRDLTICENPNPKQRPDIEFVISFDKKTNRPQAKLEAWHYTRIFRISNINEGTSSTNFSGRDFTLQIDRKSVNGGLKHRGILNLEGSNNIIIFDCYHYTIL